MSRLRPASRLCGCKPAGLHVALQAGQGAHCLAGRLMPTAGLLPLLLACTSWPQSSSGAASTLDRLTKETDANILQVNDDVASKKSLVRAWLGASCAAAAVEERTLPALRRRGPARCCFTGVGPPFSAVSRVPPPSCLVCHALHACAALTVWRACVPTLAWAVLPAGGGHAREVCQHSALLTTCAVMQWPALPAAMLGTS